MKIYAIGDVHLSLDSRIEKPMDVFGPKWANHAERLRENWIEVVRPEDVVVVCGDISWGLRLEEAMADLMFLNDLPGHKVLTKGNHDLWWNSVGKLNAISEEMTFLQNTAYMVEASGAAGAVQNAETDGAVQNAENAGEGRKIAIAGTRGWICPGTDGFDEHDKKIYERELIRLRFSLQDAKSKGADEIIAAIHYPPSNDKFQESGFTDLMEEFGVKTCVYGHLHGREAFKNGYKGVWNGVEYKLVSLDYVEAKPVLIYE